MKKNILIIMTIFSLSVLNSASAQTITTSFKVFGNCEQCKTRIEKAVKKMNGITYADWSIETKMITVKYDSALITLKKIHEQIAATGYDTEKSRADDKVYKKLPQCCQFERNPNLKPTESNNEGSIRTVKYNISGMTCEKGCANRIQNSIYKKKGVKECEVSFEKGIATIVYDENKIKKEEIVKIIENCSNENESVQPYKAVEIIQ